MDQRTVQDSLVKHLEVIEKALVWALTIALVVGWAGFHKADIIDIAGMKTDRVDAYFVASLAFVLANLAILLALLRMGDLLKLLDDSELIKGSEKVMTDSSLFNPFSYFGSGLLPRIYSASGFALLVFCWWICWTATSTLLNLAKTRSILEIALLLVGGLSIAAIHRFQVILLGRLHTIDSTYAAVVMKANNVRGKVVALFAIGGALIFFNVQWHLWK